MATRYLMRSSPLRRVRGQSIPLLALMIVVLVGMVALSVDVGRTFSEERRAVAAANAASLSAMNTYVRRPAGTTNTVIYDAIVNSLRSNGIDIENNPNVQMEAFYLDARGEPLPGGARITRDGTVAPDNVAYIQVNLRGDVDTLFARVVNQNQLPFGATAYAGTCPPTDGVYPIGINNDHISGNEFRNPGDANGDGVPDNNWQRLTSGPYRGYTKMRLYPTDGNLPGQFGWLRWLDGQGVSGANANSAQELELALTGTGTLSKGFMEVVPWPAPNLPRPATYPERPGELNVGDWVYGSSGFTASNDRREALDAHIANGTRMVLPIYDVAVGQGSNAAFRVVRFGLFVLTEYGRERNRPYMDFIFLGDPDRQGTACSATPPPPENGNVVRLTGSVELWPEYQIVNNLRRPVNYVVVLDVTGSMSMNFRGEGSYRLGNRVILAQCINDPFGQRPADPNCTGQASNAWPTVQERRIYVAKEAVRLLIDQMNMPGNQDYDNTRPNDQMALIWFRESVPVTNRFPSNGGFSSDPAALKQAVLNAGSVNGDPYLANGGTNGAGALLRAQQILQSAPRTIRYNNRDWEYRHVIIFVTDGLSNFMMNRNVANLQGPHSNASTYTPQSGPNTHPCFLLGKEVLDNAPCQTTEIGGRYQGYDRPITQMVQVANEIKANQSVQTDIYVVGISAVPTLGLRDGVASTPRHFYMAETLERGPDGLNNVDRIMLAINAEVEQGPCISGSDGEWRGTIPGNHFRSISGLSYPNVGEVILQDLTTNTTYRTPIVAGTDGRVRYTFENLPRGMYRMQAYLFYRHPLDPPTAQPRMYSQIFTNGASQSDMVVVLDPATQVGFTATVEQNLRLRLNGNVCAVSN